MISDNNQVYFKSAIIVCHDAMFGPPHELRDYLLAHGIEKLLFIGHPNKAMAENDVRSSYFEFYVHGKRTKKYVSPVLRLPELLGYIKDSICTIYWSLTLMHSRVDYFIGLGNLNAFAGLILRNIHRVKRAYYYVIDYIPNRFGNPVVNGLYHRIDEICAGQADSTWNYANRMILEREKKWKRTFRNQIVVPNGIHVRTSTLVPFPSVNHTELIYLGTLREEQGLQAVIEAMPAIRRKIPGIHLSIIGKGAYRQTLEKLVQRHQMSKHVTFVGYIRDPVKTDKRIAQCALGVATYNPKTSFVIYGEPGKIKRYLSCGVPVLMTDVTHLAKDLEHNKCGIVCSYNPRDIARKAVWFLTQSNKMEEYRRNSIKYAKSFEWERVFTDAFLRSS